MRLTSTRSALVARRPLAGGLAALALTVGLVVPAAAPARADETSSDPAQQEAPLPGADAQDPSFAEPNDPAPGGLDTQDPVESAATVEALSAYLDAAGQDPGAQALVAQDLAARGLDSGTELPGNVGTALASVGAAGTGPAAVAAPPRSWPVGTAPAGAPGLVTQLPVVHRAQVTNYYCGAAAAAQALLAIPGAERSVIDGQAISQRVLATDRYLMTDRNGKTSWAQRRLTIGMNRWLTGSDTGPYRWVDRPSPAIFLGAVHSSMNTARPMFVDAEETPASGRYNNHPDNGRVYSHIMTVRGWDSGTGEVQFVDPWSMAYFDPSGGTRILPMFWYDGHNFAAKFLGVFGIVY